MKCQEVAEFLPWFANGTLSAEEADRVRQHLADCEICRVELGETGAAFEIFDAHLAAETLIEVAWNGSTASPAAERHLSDCEVCSERLDLVRESRVALEESEPVPEAERPLPRDHLSVERFPAAAAVAASSNWRSLAMAASIAAMVATTGWIWTWQGGMGKPAQFRGAEPGTVQAPGPVLNVTIVEIEPSLAPEGADAAELPLGASGVTLILDSWLDGNLPLSCRLADADGVVVWQRDGLVAREEGGYALSFATAELEAGRYRLTLLDDDGVELEHYSIHIR